MKNPHNIVIKQIDEIPCDLYYKGYHLGTVTNAVQMAQIMVDIKKLGDDYNGDYWVKYKGNEYPIRKGGVIKGANMFPLLAELRKELMGF